jgi:hypothetical protein
VVVVKLYSTAYALSRESYVRMLRHYIAGQTVFLDEYGEPIDASHGDLDMTDLTPERARSILDVELGR